MPPAPSSLRLLSEEFPYLVTRVVPSFYHVIPLPDGLSEEELLVIAQRQITANKLDSCLALDSESGYFLSPRSNESPYKSDVIARGGILACGKLRTVPDVEYDPSVSMKIERLQERTKRGAFFLMGDLTKGNRQATRADLKRLRGQHNGIPVGLEFCNTCNEYHGECLDPGENFKGTVATVRCKCEADNLCAFCEEPLYERRLNANYFNTKDGNIWHVPAFTGFEHVCP